MSFFLFLLSSHALTNKFYAIIAKHKAQIPENHTLVQLGSNFSSLHVMKQTKDKTTLHAWLRKSWNSILNIGSVYKSNLPGS